MTSINWYFTGPLCWNKETDGQIGLTCSSSTAVVSENLFVNGILYFPVIVMTLNLLSLLRIISSNRSHIVKLPTSRVRGVWSHYLSNNTVTKPSLPVFHSSVFFQQQLKFMHTSHQFLLLSSPPAKEARFRTARKLHGSTFAFQWVSDLQKNVILWDIVFTFFQHGLNGNKCFRVHFCETAKIYFLLLYISRWNDFYGGSMTPPTFCFTLKTFKQIHIGYFC